MFLQLHSKFPEEKQYAVEGAPTPLKASQEVEDLSLRSNGHRPRKWEISRPLRLLVIFFFLNIERVRIFPKKNLIKQCVLISLINNNSWGLVEDQVRRWGWNICELLFLRERERERVRHVGASTWWSWARFQRAMPRTKLTGGEIRGHYTLSTRLSMNNATRNWPGNGEISGMKISDYYIQPIARGWPAPRIKPSTGKLAEWRHETLDL